MYQSMGEISGRNGKSGKISLLLLAAALLVLLFPTEARAVHVTLQWDRNSKNMDVAGYKMYYGTKSREYDRSVEVGKVLEYTLTGLDRDECYFFATTAYDSAGHESAYSNEVYWCGEEISSGAGSGGAGG